MGEAIGLLAECIEKDIVLNDTVNNVKGDYKALVFIMTDGDPTDPDRLKSELAKLNRKKISHIICAAVDHANLTYLEMISGAREKIVELSVSDMNTFKRFFIWVSQSMSQQIPTNPDEPNITGEVGELPPLPNEEELL